MSKKTLRRAIAAIAVMLSTGTAGCAGHEDPNVATAASGAPRAGATTGGPSSELKYSRCMRDQGLSWFPDPAPDGSLGVRVPEGTDENTYKKAQEACKKYAPGANQGGRISADDLNKIRKVSQCIREHGFSKYPDPDSNGAIQGDSKDLGFEPDDPAFRKAMRECQKYLPPRKGGGGS
ncbi:hypothetical protein [Actinomadura macrotermitis]|uniref:Lipoprotein n=1 Tax=Actinomadura macrotermitis TaxID=2585200 RepID=A0A7K0BWG5_9ACTN|nr:hypothetical protein [Actinomadura macrotermitis]MQY05508.1 hypothetical protein [Actinomadura macrotermitis]